MLSTIAALIMLMWRADITKYAPVRWSSTKWYNYCNGEVLGLNENLINKVV